MGYTPRQPLIPVICKYILSFFRYQDWEEFAKVGVNLLERLESFLEPINDDLNDNLEIVDDEELNDSLSDREQERETGEQLSPHISLCYN